MGEEITRLALECLKIDFERRRLSEESNKLMMETVKDLSPIISQFIVALVKSEGDLSSETFKEFTERLPGFVAKLPTLNDFIEFAKTISDEALESLIDDLQKMLDDREEK